MGEMLGLWETPSNTVVKLEEIVRRSDLVPVADVGNDDGSINVDVITLPALGIADAVEHIDHAVVGYKINRRPGPTASTELSDRHKRY